jgi:hypothetical protein
MRVTSHQAITFEPVDEHRDRTGRQEKVPPKLALRERAEALEVLQRIDSSEAQPGRCRHGRSEAVSLQTEHVQGRQQVASPCLRHTAMLHSSSVAY